MNNNPVHAIQSRPAPPPIPYINTAITYRPPIPRPSTQSPAINPPAPVLTPMSLCSPATAHDTQSPNQPSSSSSVVTSHETQQVAQNVIDLTVDDDGSMHEGNPKKRQKIEVEPLSDPSSLSLNTQSKMESAAKIGDPGPRLNVPVNSVALDHSAPANTFVPAKGDTTSIQPEDASEPLITDRTLIEDALGASYDEDEEDETKLWCLMCKCVFSEDLVPSVAHYIAYRSRYAQELSTQPPEPFINASDDTLVEHCKAQHPVGWGKLIETILKKYKEQAH